MTITFYTRSVYGRENIYIADETQASLVSTLTGLKTVSNSQLHALSALGLTLEQVPDPRSTVAL